MSTSCSINLSIFTYMLIYTLSNALYFFPKGLLQDYWSFSYSLIGNVRHKTSIENSSYTWRGAVIYNFVPCVSRYFHSWLLHNLNCKFHLKRKEKEICKFHYCYWLFPYSFMFDVILDFNMSRKHTGSAFSNLKSEKNILNH